MSESIIKNKYLNLEGLRKYDELIKKLIADGDSNLSAAIAALDAKIGSLDIDGSDDKNIANAIADIYTSITEIVDAQEGLSAKDEELAGEIADIVNNKLKAIEDSVSENANNISGIDSRVATLEGTIDDLKNLGGENGLVAVVEKVNKNTEDIKTLTNNVATATSTANEAKSAAESAVADAALAKTTAESAAADAAKAMEDASSAAANVIVANATAELAKDNADIAKTDAAKAMEDASAAKTAAESAAAAIEELKGEGDNSVKKIAEDAAAEAVAAVVAGAESDFDTLKEVADWIASDKEGSAALQVSVSKNTEDITKLDAKVEADITNLTNHLSDYATVLGQVDGRLDALEAFEETHESIAIEDIEGMFA